MASADGEGDTITPMIVEDTPAAADVSEIAAFYTESTDAADAVDEAAIVVAAEEGSGPTPSLSNTSTPNGKANPSNNNNSSNKKQKLDNGGGEGRKEREEWNESEVRILLDTYLEKYIALNRSNLRGQDWKVVGELVAGVSDKNSKKSIEQCKNKVDNLKKRFKTEIQKMEKTGSTISSWNWFKKLEAIVGYVPATPKNVSDDDTRGNSSAPRRSARLTSGGSPFTPFTNNLKSKSAHNPKWQRVIFKVSGTALAGTGESIDPKVALQLADEVAKASRQGVEVAIVLGGRNFFCGDSWVSATDLDRPTAYQIGMMATVMNSVLLQSALEKLGIQTRVQSAFAIPEVAEPYNRLRAMRHLEKGRVVIFGGIGAGTGNPLFTTDTGAALRATEINADAVLKGTNVNGIYDGKSRHRNAKTHLSFREVVIKDVTAMDTMAIQYCEENELPVVIFNLLEPGHVAKALVGEQVGTLIDQEGSRS